MAIAEPVFVAAFTFAILYLPMQTARALWEGRRSWPRANAWMVVSLPLLPGLAAFFHVALLGELTTAWPQLRLAFLFAPATPLALAALGHVTWDQYDTERQWSQLPLDAPNDRPAYS